MELYDAIFARKSVRKYQPEPMSPQFLEEAEAAISGFRPLYPEIPLQHRFATKTKGRFSVAAPHFLIVSGQGLPGELENTGFLYEQLVLWLDAKGVGSVWLGSTHDAEGSSPGKDIITIAFGAPAEPLHRTAAEFKRKPMAEITNISDEVLMEPVRLAPSGVNLQPWYFEQAADAVRVYRQKLRPPMSLAYKLANLDVGIALCHYALTREKAGRAFAFQRTEQLPGKKGFLPFGEIR